MENQQFQDDIRFVKQMIENNRRTLVDNGINYIVAGIFVAVGVIAGYILGVNGRDDLFPYLWLGLIVIILFVSIILQKKIGKKHTTKTFGSKVFSAVWFACGIPILIIALIFVLTESISMPAFFTACSAILGVGYYLTGFINDLKFMKYLAAGWWAGSVLAMLWENIGEVHQLALLFSVMIVLFQVIPGIIIYSKWKRVYNG